MKKSLIQESFRKFLEETRFEVTSLSDGVVLIENGNSLTLYDSKFINKPDNHSGVLAYIALSHNRNVSSVDVVAAKKGYGPLIYQLAMEFVSPSPLLSSRDGDTRDEAIRIWSYFLTNSDELGVTVETIDSNDDDYTECLEWGCDDEDPHFFKVYNSKYYADDTNDYFMLVEYGEELLEKVGDEYRDVISTLGHDYFDYRY